MALPPALSLPTQVAAQAEFIVSNLRQTDYQHTEHIDVDRGIYDCDCDGFVGFVLTRVAPDQYAMIPQEAGQSRPRAFEYCLFFSSLTPQSAGWHRIDFLRDVRRGDFIAWRFPEVEIEEGHAGMSLSRPKRPEWMIQASSRSAYTILSPSRISTIRAETARGSSRTELDTARSSSGSTRGGGP